MIRSRRHPLETERRGRASHPPAGAGERLEREPHASLESFVRRLASMTVSDLERVSAGIEAEMASSADWLEWRRAIESSDRAVRRSGRVREAGVAGHTAAEAVLTAMRDQVNLPDARVTSVARWARDVAGALVAGDLEPEAAQLLLRPWEPDCSRPAA